MSLGERSSLQLPPLSSIGVCHSSFTMSHDLDSSLLTQMAIATLKETRGDYLEIKKMESKRSARRRVFVQTETGSVFGIELDRSDNAHTVKKRLQLGLKVPVEESSLTYGDMVLKNDLSAVRNDSPLLLTRKFLHRSSSTPCLSPTAEDIQQRDQSGPIEILGCSDCFAPMKLLARDIVMAIENAIDPVPVSSGLGGSYYFRNCDGENIAIVKPTDEEPFAPNNPKGWVGNTLGQPGLKRSVRVGETGFREVAAYLLDHDHFASVPSTALVKITHSIFNVNNRVNGNMNQNGKQVSKIASLQQFIPHDFDASDHGASCFTVSAVHRIGILDIRILNTDRHAGNVLVRRLNGFGQVELVPIDHGLCLPESLEDPYFEWIHWPQASIPFSEEELEYINNLDPIYDSDMLRMELPMIREACLRVLVLCTIFLKEAAAFGLSLAEIGEMMSREFKRHKEFLENKDEPSKLETICIEARKLLEKMEVLVLEKKETGEEEFQFDIDREEEELDLSPNMERKFMAKTISHLGFTNGNGRNPVSCLEENVQEEKAARVTNRKDTHSQVAGYQVPSALKLPMPLTEVGQRTMPKDGCLAHPSSGNWSVHKKFPPSTSFELADINGEDWAQFLEIFQKLLHPAFVSYRSSNLVQRPRQRLGASC